MYLQKAPNGVYQTRVCIPKPLRAFGYPFDIKVSLLTKERSEAIDRNFKIASCIKVAISRIDQVKPASFRVFKHTLSQHIAVLRQSFTVNSMCVSHPESLTYIEDNVDADLSTHVEFSRLDDIETSVKEVSSFTPLLKQFLDSKKIRHVRQLTIHQLNQRITHCITFLEQKGVNCNTVTSADLEGYIDLLYSEGRSAKTNKEYFSAMKQFFKWMKSSNYILDNPAQDLNPQFKSKKHASEQRERWAVDELMLLMKSPEFSQQSLDFQWITKLQLYHGLRTGEACQLYIQDVVLNGDIPYLSITDKSQYQHLKNGHAIRRVPLHPAILNEFILFYQSRFQKGNSPLFNYSPLGNDQDWTKRYRTQFGKLQTKLGMSAGKRPTAYGLRHTFIDELKAQDILEHSVAEVVGHTNSNMTFGRYGKKHNLAKLLEIVSAFTLQLEGE